MNDNIHKVEKTHKTRKKSFSKNNSLTNYETKQLEKKVDKSSNSNSISNTVTTSHHNTHEQNKSNPDYYININTSEEKQFKYKSQLKKLSHPDLNKSIDISHNNSYYNTTTQNSIVQKKKVFDNISKNSKDTLDKKQDEIDSLRNVGLKLYKELNKYDAFLERFKFQDNFEIELSTEYDTCLSIASNLGIIKQNDSNPKLTLKHDIFHQLFEIKKIMKLGFQCYFKTLIRRFTNKITINKLRKKELHHELIAFMAKSEESEDKFMIHNIFAVKPNFHSEKYTTYLDDITLDRSSIKDNYTSAMKKTSVDSLPIPSNKKDSGITIIEPIGESPRRPSMESPRRASQIRNSTVNNKLVEIEGEAGQQYQGNYKDMEQEILQLQKQIQLDKERLENLKSIKQDRLEDIKLYRDKQDKHKIQKMLNEINLTIEDKYLQYGSWSKKMFNLKLDLYKLKDSLRRYDNRIKVARQKGNDKMTDLKDLFEVTEEEVNNPFFSGVPQKLMEDQRTKIETRRNIFRQKVMLESGIHNIKFKHVTNQMAYNIINKIKNEILKSNKESSKMIQSVLKAQAQDKGSYVNVQNTLDIAKFENEKLTYRKEVITSEIKQQEEQFSKIENSRVNIKVDNNLIMHSLIEGLWPDREKLDKFQYINQNYLNNLKNKLFQLDELKFHDEKKQTQSYLFNQNDYVNVKIYGIPKDDIIKRLNSVLKMASSTKLTPQFKTEQRLSIPFVEIKIEKSKIFESRNNNSKFLLLDEKMSFESLHKEKENLEHNLSQYSIMNNMSKYLPFLFGSSPMDQLIVEQFYGKKEALDKYNANAKDNQRLDKKFESSLSRNQQQDTKFNFMNYSKDSSQESVLEEICKRIGNQPGQIYTIIHDNQLNKDLVKIQDRIRGEIDYERKVNQFNGSIWDALMLSESEILENVRKSLLFNLKVQRMVPSKLEQQVKDIQRSNMTYKDIQEVLKCKYFVNMSINKNSERDQKVIDKLCNIILDSKDSVQQLTFLQKIFGLCQQRDVDEKLKFLQNNRLARTDSILKLNDKAEEKIQEMIKNNLKSKKNKRSKGSEVSSARRTKKLPEENTKVEADDSVIEKKKQEIAQDLCGGVIIDQEESEQNALTYKDMLKLSSAKKKAEPKSMHELLENLNSVDNEHYKLNKASIDQLQVVNFKLNRYVNKKPFDESWQFVDFKRLINQLEKLNQNSIFEKVEE